MAVKTPISTAIHKYKAETAMILHYGKSHRNSLAYTFPTKVYNFMTNWFKTLNKTITKTEIIL
jgi:hypothetical protein